MKKKLLHCIEKYVKKTNQRSNNEIEASRIEVEVEDLRHVIVEIGLHAAVARLALIP